MIKNCLNYGHPPLTVEIERPAFSDIWTVVSEDQSFDFWIEDLREWLLMRNADEHSIDKALDEAYHFRKAVMVIKNPRKIKQSASLDAPQLD